MGGGCLESVGSGAGSPLLHRGAVEDYRIQVANRSQVHEETPRSITSLFLSQYHITLRLCIIHILVLYMIGLTFRLFFQRIL